jgi:hypothetical protein
LVESDNSGMNVEALDASWDAKLGREKANGVPPELD